MRPTRARRHRIPCISTSENGHSPQRKTDNFHTRKRTQSTTKNGHHPQQNGRAQQMMSIARERRMLRHYAEDIRVPTRIPYSTPRLGGCTRVKTYIWHGPGQSGSADGEGVWGAGQTALQGTEVIAASRSAADAGPCATLGWRRTCSFEVSIRSRRHKTP